MHTFRRLVTRVVMVAALAGGTLALTTGVQTAGAATSDTYFSCYSLGLGSGVGLISAQSPVVTPPNAGMSNEIVYWVPEYLSYNSSSRQWVHDHWGKWAHKSLYGYGGAMSWYFTDGSGVADNQSTLVRSGSHAVRNWVYHTSTGQFDPPSKGWNMQYLLHPEQGGGNNWCSTY